MGKRKNTLWGMFREAAVSVLRDVTGGGGTIERAPGLLPVGTILGLDDMVDAYTASSVACEALRGDQGWQRGQSWASCYAQAHGRRADVV